MSQKALADYTQYAKYARYIPEKKRREKWVEQVDRVADMHRRQLGDKLELIKDEFEFAVDMVKKRGCVHTTTQQMKCSQAAKIFLSFLPVCPKER